MALQGGTLTPTNTPVVDALYLQNIARTFQYRFIGAAILADFDVTVPALTAAGNMAITSFPNVFTVTQTITQGAVAGGASALVITPGAHTAVVAEVNDVLVNAHTITITAGYATQRFVYIATPTITAAAPLTITTGTTFEVQSVPTVAGSAAVTNLYGFNFSGGAVNIANVAGTAYRAIRTGAHTITLTTVTQITGLPSISALALNIITINQSGGAVIVDGTATFYISGPPAAGAGVTLSDNYAMWVDDGRSRFDGNIVMLAGTDIRPTADSTTAINIAQANGTDFFIFDTTNKDVMLFDTSTIPSFTILSRQAAGYFPAQLLLGRQGAAAVATPDTSQIGEIRFQGLDTAPAYVVFAQIEAIIGVNAATGAPTDMIFRVGATGVSASSRESLRLASTSSVFNEASLDIDFRIESNGNANAFVLDAGVFGNVGQLSIGAAAQATSTAFVIIDNPAITATSNQEWFKLLISNSAAVTITGATTSAIVATLGLEEPNITATGIVTVATTLYIRAAPTEGASNYAAWVDAGNTRLDGQLLMADKIYPATDAAALQTAIGIYAGTGAPNNANGADGDLYFRSDGGALTTEYQRRAGIWVGIV